MKWFKHDTDANRNPKLEKVIMKYGADGYALYWLCLELIAAPIDKSHITFELKHDCEVLGHRLHVDTLRIEEIMLYMVNIGLFESDETKTRISCLALAEKIENSIVKNPHMKALQKDIKNGKKLNYGLLESFKSGIIPENSGKLGLDIDTDIDTESSATTMKAVEGCEVFKMMLDWEPDEDTSNSLLADACVTGQYLDEYLIQWRLYWHKDGRFRNEAAWGTLFYNQCSDQWKKEQGIK